MAHDDEDLEEGPGQESGEEDDSPVDGAEAPTPDAVSSPAADFRMPEGFAKSVMPSLDAAVAKMVAPIREQMKAMIPDTSAYARDIMGPLNRRIQEQMNGRILRTDEGLSWSAVNRRIDHLTSRRGNVLRPLSPVPVAALVSAEWVGIPIRRGWLRHAPRLASILAEESVSRDTT